MGSLRQILNKLKILKFKILLKLVEIFNTFVLLVINENFNHLNHFWKSNDKMTKKKN